MNSEKGDIFYTWSKKWVKSYNKSSGINGGDFSWVLPLFLLGLRGGVATGYGRLIVVFGQEGELALNREVLGSFFFKLLDFPVLGPRVATTPVLVVSPSALTLVLVPALVLTVTSVASVL